MNDPYSDQNREMAFKRVLFVNLQGDWQAIRNKIINESKHYKNNSTQIPETITFGQIAGTVEKGKKEKDKNLPHKVLEYMATHIESKAIKKDKNLKGSVGTDALRDFLRSPSNRRAKKKRSDFLNAIAIYCGYQGYADDFLPKWYKFIGFINDLYNLHKKPLAYYQEKKEYLSKNEAVFKELLAEEDKQKYEAIVAAKQEQLQASKNLEDMKMYELFEMMKNHQEQFVDLYQAIVLYDKDFEIIEKKQRHKQRMRRGGLGLLLLIFLFGTAFTARQLLIIPKATQAELHNIKHKILSIDQSPLGHATVRMTYDASHIGKTLEGKGIVLGGGRPFIKKEISKSIDTLSFIYERGGRTDYHFWVVGEESINVPQPFILPLPDWTAYIEAQYETGKHLWNSKQRQKSESMDNGHLRFQYPIKEKYRNYYSSFYSYAKPIAASLNDFKIEIRSKLLPDSLLNGTCFHNNLALASDEEDYFTFHMLEEGCSKWGGLIYGHHTLREDTQNLRGFICPKSELFNWHTVRVQVKNRILTYTFNGRKIYSRKIPKLKGGLDAIRQDFKGMGMIDYVRVWNGKGELVYGEEFEE